MQWKREVGTKWEQVRRRHVVFVHLPERQKSSSNHICSVFERTNAPLVLKRGVAAKYMCWALDYRTGY